MLELTTLQIISAIGGMLGAIGGLFAAIAAFRSAGIAAKAANLAQNADRRSLVREVNTATRNTISECTRIEDLANRLNESYTSLAVFTGNVGGSRHKMLTEQVESNKKQAEELRRSVEAELSGTADLSKLAVSELESLFARHSGLLPTTKAIREKLETEFASVEKQLLIFQERAIRGQ